MRWTYLILDIVSFSIPFLYSFHPKMKLIRWWKPILISISITAIFFITWDIFFAVHGIWGFNPTYLLGYNLIHLPFEEWLFFWMIPYASLFIYFSLLYFKPRWSLSMSFSKTFSVVILFGSLLVLLFHFDKTYTLVNLVTLTLVLGYTLIVQPQLLSRFYLAYLVILIPFIIVNGALTGMFTQEPVVWYNNLENLGIRIITIPVEDFAYAFSMLLMSLNLIEKQTKIDFNHSN